MGETSIAEIIHGLLSDLGHCDIQERRIIQLHRSIEHPQEDVKRFGLIELKKLVDDEHTALLICEETDLLAAVINCVHYDNIKIAKCAMSFLTEFGKLIERLKILYSTRLLNAIKTTLNENDVIRFRMYEVLLAISSYSSAHFEITNNLYLLNGLLNILNEDDILTKLTALSMLTKLAVTDHGFQFLETNKFFQLLSSKFDNFEEPDTTLWISGVVTFFGSIAHIKPEEIFSNYSTVIELTFSLVKSDNLSLQKTAIETIGFIGHTTKGKLAFKPYYATMNEILPRLADIVEVRPVPYKVIVLNCIDNLMYFDNDEQPSYLLELTKHWFTTVFSSLDIVLQLYQKPFPELQLAILQLLLPISKLHWGQKLIEDTPGFVEVLLNREEKNTMDCKVVKYHIIETIATSLTSKLFFAPETIQQFCTYVKNGISYVEPIIEVAVEGA